MGKVNFKYGISDIKANLDDLIVYYSPKRKRNVARKWVMPSRSESNNSFAAIQSNLGAVWRSASAGYKRDFRVYAEFLSNQTDVLKSVYALFVAMMYAYKALDPEVNLGTLSRDEILSGDMPVKSVRAAVDAELLTAVLADGIGGNLI